MRFKIQYFALVMLSILVSIQTASATSISTFDFSDGTAANEPAVNSPDLVSMTVWDATAFTFDGILTDVSTFRNEVMVKHSGARLGHAAKRSRGPVGPSAFLDPDSGKLGTPQGRIEPVPEPSSLLLLGSGFLVVASFRYKKLRKRLLPG